jgi:hypothetical protein
MSEEPLEQRVIRDEPPPVLGRWPRVYTFILLYLASVIGAFYFVTRQLAP